MTDKASKADKPSIRGWNWLTATGVLAALGGVLIGDSVVMADKAGKTRGWKKAPGIVEKSSAEVKRNSSGKRWVVLRVAYQYKVGGKVYRSRQLHLGKESWTYQSENRASADYQKYSKGNKVEIHYDPKAPDRAVLERLPAKHGSLRGTVGYVFLGVAIIPLVVFLFWLRTWLRARKTWEDRR